ncbi:hypothetical protein [Pseudarthrobacter sp. 1C304]|uniref:hypothetical protein n=1 Tax=Pseudarthrobacter sp. 1C304 TaxID=3457438 RepID=UPI003FD3D3AB
MMRIDVKNEEIHMYGKQSRRLVPAAAMFAALALAAPASAVAADPPPEYPGCEDFNITFTFTGGNQADRVVREKDGVIYTITAGHGTVLTVTNAETLKSVTFPTQGSVTQVTQYPDGTADIQLTGKNLFILFPGDDPGPSTKLYTGRVTFSNDANGRSTVTSTSGTQRDICAELAP